MSMLAPYAIGGIASWLGSRGRKRTPQVQPQSPEAGLTASAAAQTDLAKSINRMMTRQYSLAEPAYMTGLDYYRRLLGSSGSLMAATQPERQQAGEAYMGAERMIGAGALRGAQRERALAELSRERAGTLSSIPAAARAGAAGNLASLGAQGLGLAGTFAGQEGALRGNISSIFQQMLDREQQRQLANRQSWQQAGVGLAQIFIPWLLGQRGGGK